MPTFSPFRHLNLFRVPATKQVVNWRGGVGGQQVSTSSLDTSLKSVPFWWLLRKLSFTASWEITIIDYGGPNDDMVKGGTFTAEFVVEESPNDKICRTYLDEPTFLNLIEGGPDPTPNFAEITATSGDVPYSDYFPTFNIEAFQCEKTHAVFYVSGEGANFSASMNWYITSGPREDVTEFEDVYNIFEEEITITLPNNETATLLVCADLYSGGTEWEATTNIQLNQIEWWELG